MYMHKLTIFFNLKFLNLRHVPKIKTSCLNAHRTPTPKLVFKKIVAVIIQNLDFFFLKPKQHV
jgi:hypothetical protein